MSKVTVTESHLEDIGDAIRGKLGTSQGYTPGQMAAAIESIPTGVTPTGTINITQNGQTDVTQYASAAVNVPNSYAAGDEGKVVQNGALVAQTSETVAQNGTYDTTTKNEVVVNVQGGGTPNLQDKTVTQNGTYTADAGYDGLGTVTVNVSGGGGGDPFIESQATAYLNTGIAGNTVYGILLEFIPITVANAYQWYAGGASNNFTIASMDASSGVTSGFIRCGNVDFGIVTFLKGQKNTVLCSGGKVTVNGVELAGTYTGAINTNSTTIRFFGSGSGSLSHARVYKCVLYDANGEVIHNYEPAADSDFIPCLHDIVTGNYIYGNNNKLTYGADA